MYFGSVRIANGIYTVGAGQTYSTIAAAISDLNASAIGGAVTFNVVAGHTETFASLTAS